MRGSRPPHFIGYVLFGSNSDGVCALIIRVVCALSTNFVIVLSSFDISFLPIAGKKFPINGYSDKPKRVEGFTGWGKGIPAGIAVGPTTSCVALMPWDGPDEETWEYEQEELADQKRRERERRKREEQERKDAIRRQREHERVVALRRLEKYHPLCSICVNVAPYTHCFGFWPNAKRPMQCGSCGHERSQHRAERKLEDSTVWTFDVIMNQEKQVAKVMEEAGATMAKNADAGEQKMGVGQQQQEEGKEQLMLKKK